MIDNNNINNNNINNNNSNIIIKPNSLCNVRKPIFSEINILEYPSSAPVYKSGSITGLSAEIVPTDGNCENFLELSLGITLVSVFNNYLIIETDTLRPAFEMES